MKNTKKLLVIFLALTLVALPLWVACAPEEVAPPPEEVAPPPEEEAPPPKPEGTLEIGVADFAGENFLPWVATSQAGTYQALVYDYLFYSDLKTRELIPGLAKRFEMSEDARTITIWMREGVPWQDATYGEVTAYDVKYTIERCAEEGSVNIQIKEYKKIEEIEVLDAYTLVLHLKEPDPLFWLNLTIGQNPYLPIVCKDYIETVGEDEAGMYRPMGSGPYRLAGWKPGLYIKFEALEQHWRVVPEFKYLTLRLVPDESTKIAMLKTGELDIAPISPFKVRELQEAGVGASLWAGGYPVGMAWGNMYVPEDNHYVEGYSRTDPWADVRVREAMNIAIDREAIIEAIYKGGATPTTLWCELPGSEELEPYPYDPERAKQLLAEAGYPNGFTVNIYTRPIVPGAEMPIVAEAVAGYWEAIGLSPKIEKGEMVGCMKLQTSGKTLGYVYPFTGGWQQDYTRRMTTFHCLNGPLTFYQDEELIRLIERILPESDYEKRTAMWREVAEYMHDNYVSVHICVARPAWAYNTKKIDVESWPKNPMEIAHMFEYIRHAEPLNTPRLFTP
jgi:peptide/nickel transport system substrate-binding protein